MATGWTTGVRLPAGGLELHLFATASRPALGIHQPHIQWVFFQGAKRPGREADHSIPHTAKVKNAWKYTSTPPIRLHGVALN